MSLAQRRRGRPRFLALALPTTNLFARFIAGTGETVSSGKVTSWADQSGNGWTATPVGANAPYSTTDYRGRRVIRLYGVEATSLQFAAAHSFDARNVAVFMVARSFSPSGQTQFGLLNYTGGSGHLRWNSSPKTLFAVNRAVTIKPQMNPMMTGAVTDATATAGYSQYQPVTGQPTVTADSDCAGATIGQYSGGTVSDMDIYEMAVYDGALSGTDITNITTYFTNKYRLRSTDYRKNMVFEGDSITFGVGVVQSQSYPLQTLRRGVEDWRMTNAGVSGSTIVTMTARAASTDSFLEAGYTRNLLMVLIGRNDLDPAVGALTAQQTFDALVTYVQARVTAGWEVWVGTCIGTTSSTIQALIVAFNAKLRGTDGPGIIVAAGAARVVDFAAIPELADATAAANTTYYQDGTHPTAAGAALMANLVALPLGAY